MLAAANCRIGIAAVALVSMLAHGAPRSFGSDSGATSYQMHCAGCHGVALEGGAGPSLKGSGFSAQWSGHESSLAGLVESTMPLNAPGSLDAAQYRRIVQYLLTSNGVRADSSLALQPHLKPAPDEPQQEPGPQRPRVYGVASSRGPDDAELLHPAAGDWLDYNRDLESSRFSPLTQITQMNARELAPQCIFQAGELGTFQASPIAWRGRLFVTTTHMTFALDGATCRVLWKHQYVPTRTEQLPANRGVALYDGMVIRGTSDGYLFALDAMTGKLLWSVNVINDVAAGFVNAAPVAFGGKVFVGVGCGDTGVMGRVYAFDARTGSHLWTFDVVPKDARQRRQSWGADPSPAGGAVWSTITVDPATRSLFVSTGNPSPDLDGSMRPGNNLYTDSVVVLDADTGRLRWFVQQVPHDTHDWDTAAAPVLYEQDGHKMMAVGSKDAYLYLYDRGTHRLVARTDLAHWRINDTLPLSATKKLHVCPGIVSGVEWNGPAYDPLERLLFVNSLDWCGLYEAEPPSVRNLTGGFYDWDDRKDARGALHALDAATGRQRWVYWADSPMLSAVTATASGLLLTGTGSGRFLVLDAASGKRLYSFDTGGTMGGGVTAYLAGGTERIAILSGNNSKAAWGNSGSPILLIFGIGRSGS